MNVSMRLEELRNIKAVIFDLDGTIVDSEPLHEKVFYELFGELGHPDDHGIHFEEYYGTSDEAVWRDFVKKFPQDQSMSELLAWKQERYLQMLVLEKPIFPGVHNLIDELSSRYSLAIASGSRHTVIDRVLNLGALDSYFPVRISSQDVKNGKPDPEIFILTAHKLGIEPRQCVVIEDSVFGVQAANSAGMLSIGITNTFSGNDLQDAWKVVQNYQEISHIFLDT